MRLLLVRTARISSGISARGGRPAMSDIPSRMNETSLPLVIARIELPSITVPSLIQTRTTPLGRDVVTSASEATRSIAISFFSLVASIMIGSPNFSTNPRTMSPLRRTTSSASAACTKTFVG